MDQYIGKMLDNRYEILERIGTGGMAVVYKAKCHRLNRLVAVKILKADLAQDEDFRSRFNAESNAVAQLSHPNIVSVYDVSRGSDIEYIVMELIDGITLKQYIEKRGKMNWREPLHFITQIMRGLSHAHSRGIVHRDIKPQNIMVLRDSSVRVTDFGIACLENSAQTLTQEALGSVHYISPEQARGDRIDTRSDIYSAGVVLYEMLTGRLPFEGESAVSVAIQHLSAIPLAPREIDPDIPEQLELICMKAMAPDLDRRYASADEMIADLEAFRKNPEIDLDFDLSDLRPTVPDEPTQPLRTGSRVISSGIHHSNAPELDDDTDDAVSKKKSIIFAAAGVLAVIVAVLLFRSILTSFEEKPVEQYVVESVLGLTVEEAEALPGVKDIFKIEVTGTISSDEYPVDTIAKQDPAPEVHRKGENLVINVWLSSGEETESMPNLSNMTVNLATSQLKRLKEEYQLTIEVREEDKQFDSSITEGYVITTIPAAGDAVRKGDAIRLIVSKGPELKEIPVGNFVDQKIDAVLTQLPTTWKLTCTEADIEYVPSTTEAGTILWQSLEPNTIAREWDTIKFQVSTGEIPVVMEEPVALPQDGRTSVYVEVYVGDEKRPQYNETVLCSNVYEYVTLSGRGLQQIRIYIDGVLDTSQTHYLQFE